MPTSQPWGGSEWARMHMHTTQACEKQLLQSLRLPALTLYTQADMFHCCSDRWKRTHEWTVTGENIYSFIVFWALRILLSEIEVFGGSVGTDHWAKDIKMIGWITSTGSPFWLLYDLWRTTANYGSSHRSPDSINIQSRRHIQELIANACVMRTSVSCLLPFFF